MGNSKKPASGAVAKSSGKSKKTNQGPGKEWVAIIEALYVSPEDGKPCFKGRWYWTLSEVQEHWRGGGEKARASKNSKHELISSDKRDSNPVEVINRKATILSWKNFRDLYKRNRARCEGVYYTDRMYYHKAFKFQELSHITFPGDKVPGIPQPPSVGIEHDPPGEQDGDAYELRAHLDDQLKSADACAAPKLVPVDTQYQHAAVQSSAVSSYVTAYHLY